MHYLTVSMATAKQPEAIKYVAYEKFTIVYIKIENSAKIMNL